MLDRRRKIPEAKSPAILIRASFTIWMLDPETSPPIAFPSFSFTFGTLGALVGYSYHNLAFSRSLVQGHLEFADMPANLPIIFAGSAVTWVAATGLTAAKGSKGAGEVEPSWSDLLTVGGVVAPERVQFLVWTLLGVVIFMYLAFLSDPAAIQSLPMVPPNFLLIMGASSAAYLGGKAVRGAGPVITSATGVLEEASKLIIEFWVLWHRRVSESATPR